MKQQLNEIKRMQELAGIISEAKVIPSNTPHGNNITKWKNLGSDFTYASDIDAFLYQNDFMFFFNGKENRFETKVEYLDYGDTEDEGEDAIEPTLIALADTLYKKGIGYRTWTTSSGLIIFIYME